MTNKFWFLIICLLLATPFPLELYAQNPESCAISRLQSASPSALASPRHINRMNQYDMTFYGLDLKLERNTVYIEGTVTLEADLKVTSLDTFAFELHPDFQITAVIINGVQQQTINRQAGDVSVKLNNPVQAPAKIRAAITYKGSAPQSASAAIGNGFSTSTETTWGNQVTWSLSEPYAAYEWWPTKQVLTDKADSVHVFVTTSAENKVGSNGLLTKTIDLANGKRRYEWKSRYPIDYYLVSVAVSTYDEYLIYANPAGAPAPIPILNYVYSGGALDKFRTEIDMAAPFIEHFSGLFTLYPFAKEKYGHSMAPMGGGMEHQTMTTQSTFTFTLTAHELAHQWFGDNVTCASWQDIWLNEGFASYAEYLALQQFSPQNAPFWMENAHAYALDAPTGSVFVTDTTDVSRIFSYRLSYKKAAAVVHMLRFELNNDALFFKALQNYQQQYQGRTATTEDLQQVFEQTTGLALDYFFEQWIRGSGYPVFAVEWNQDGNNVLLVSNQSTSGGTGFFRTPIEYRIQTATQDTIIRVEHNEPIEKHLIALNRNEPVTNITVDPYNWVLNLTTKVLQNTALPVPTALVEEPLIYPNPTTAFIYVSDLSFMATTATLYDRIGRQVWQFQFPGKSELTLDMHKLPAGLYFLQLTDKNNSYRTPIIKLD